MATAFVAEPDSRALGELAESFWSERLTAAGVIVERAVTRGELDTSVDAGHVVELIASQIWFRIMARRGTVDEDWLIGVVEAAVPPAG